MRADARRNYDSLLETARSVIHENGADASLRDIARRAEVSLPTLYRHFPTREALLDVLLRTAFDDLAAQAVALETGQEASESPENALATWLQSAVAFAHRYRGVTTLMMAAIEDAGSALHVSCVTMRAAGSRLLLLAQQAGTARADLDGTDLFALIAAMSWLNDQPSSSQRSEHLFDVILRAILPLDRPDKLTKTAEKMVRPT